LAEGLKPWQVLTEGEKIRRRELVRDSKSALEQGLTLEQYVAKREHRRQRRRSIETIMRRHS
jgi:hypothetical protein